MTKAGLLCIVSFGVFAFVIFSPGFSFERPGTEISDVARLAVVNKRAESGEIRDSAPLFLPTSWNFGVNVTPKELVLEEPKFLPRKGSSVDASTPKAIELKNVQDVPPIEDALEVSSWEITRDFGFGKMSVPQVVGPVQSAVRIFSVESGKEIFSGELIGVEGDAPDMLIAPAEFIVGVASGYGRPQLAVVRSCGNIEYDKQISKAASRLLTTLNLPRGMYRIVIDLR